MGNWALAYSEFWFGVVGLRRSTSQIGRGLIFCREPPAARPRLSEERLLSAHPPDALPVGGGAVVPDRRQGAPSIRRVFPAPQVDEKERLVPDAVSSCNTWSQGHPPAATEPNPRLEATDPSSQ